VIAVPAFPLASPLGSTDSAPVNTGLFAGFFATMGDSEFLESCVIGLRLSAFPTQTKGKPQVDSKTSRFPRKERLCMPGSTTTPGRRRSCDDERLRVAFRIDHGVGAQKFIFAAQFPAYACPDRRFVDTLTAVNARLGVDMTR
jgi:hypothetical protein